MTKNYFAMLTCQNGGITPMMADDELATFDTVQECFNAATDTVLGSHFGFEVFSVGNGDASG